MKKKLGHLLVVGSLLLAGNFVISDAVSANGNEVDLSSISEEVMPNEVKEIVEILNSGKAKGNKTDGFTITGDPNASIFTPNKNPLNLYTGDEEIPIQIYSLPGQHKFNGEYFGYSNSGYSLIDITVGDPGFWNSAYQNKYDGYGYTSQLNGTYTPTRAVATVYATATGVIPNISHGGSSWGLFNSTREVGQDVAEWSTRKYAQAYVDNVRVTNIANLIVKFETKSELHYSAVGSRTTFSSVSFW